MKTEIERMYRAFEQFQMARDKANKCVIEACDFNASITWAAGDGHLILNEDTSSVAPMSCLIGKNKRNKLTEEEHSYQSY